MKTDDLIALLASGAGAAEPNAVARRLTTALGAGVVSAMLLMIITYGVRPDIGEAAHMPMLWIKLAFPASLVLGSLLATSRLARPGAQLGRVPIALAAPVLAMWLLSAFVLLGAQASMRAQLILGATWATCPFSIAMLSAPAFGAATWAMKGLAPTRLALAGAAGGLWAGAVGALAYALHCPEMSAPFLAIWYVAGMLIPTAAGAWLGPRVLHW
jgi:hypothetical protein